MTKKVALMVLAVLVLALLSALPKSFSNPVFNSKAIETLFEMLPEGIRYQVSELRSETPGDYFIDADMICEKCKIIAKFNQFGELSHLGLNLIADNQEDKHLSIVFEYIERTLLTYCLTNDNQSVINLMQREKVEMDVNGIPVDSSFAKPFRSIITFNESTPFRIFNDPDNFQATWNIDYLNHAEIRFPNNFNTISGKDKYELENELVRELMNLPAGKEFSVKIPENGLEDYNENIWVLQGNIYKGIREITSDYYLYRNDSLRPVYDKDNLLESASNLLLNVIPTNIRLQLSHKLYGDRHESFLTGLNDFYHHFNHGYTFYFGWQSIEADQLLASIFINNRLFDYSHLLIVGFHGEDIFNENRILQATFYSFTPHGNNKKEQ